MFRLFMLILAGALCTQALFLPQDERSVAGLSYCTEQAETAERCMDEVVTKLDDLVSYENELESVISKLDKLDKTVTLARDFLALMEQIEILNVFFDVVDAVVTTGQNLLDAYMEDLTDLKEQLEKTCLNDCGAILEEAKETLVKLRTLKTTCKIGQDKVEKALTCSDKTPQILNYSQRVDQVVDSMRLEELRNQCERVKQLIISKDLPDLKAVESIERFLDSPVMDFMAEVKDFLNTEHCISNMIGASRRKRSFGDPTASFMVEMIKADYETLKSQLNKLGRDKRSIGCFSIQELMEDSTVLLSPLRAIINETVQEFTRKVIKPEEPPIPEKQKLQYSLAPTNNGEQVSAKMVSMQLPDILDGQNWDCISDVCNEWGQESEIMECEARRKTEKTSSYSSTNHYRYKRDLRTVEDKVGLLEDIAELGYYIISVVVGVMG